MVETIDNKKKISQLPEAETPEGLFAFAQKENEETPQNFKFRLEKLCTLENGSGENSIKQKGTGAAADDDDSAAFGRNATASGPGAFAEGYAPQSDNVENILEASGEGAHVEGYVAESTQEDPEKKPLTTKQSIIASGRGAHAEGYAIADDGETETELATIASGDGAHAEGHFTQAIGAFSHAEGSKNKSVGWNSHSEGNHTEANSAASHAEGYYTKAEGNYSHSEGRGTKTSNEAEHASGKYNATHSDAGNKTIFSVGVGTSQTRKNAFEVMDDGRAFLLGLGGYDGIHIYAGTKDINAIVCQKQAVSITPGGEVMLDFYKGEDATIALSYQIGGTSPQCYMGQITSYTLTPNPVISWIGGEACPYAEFRWTESGRLVVKITNAAMSTVRALLNK